MKQNCQLGHVQLSNVADINAMNRAFHDSLVYISERHVCSTFTHFYPNAPKRLVSKIARLDSCQLGTAISKIANL